jgi:hypothetical protein
MRDHGPEDAAVLLTLYTIGTYMNNTGYAYPSQKTIAHGARASTRTVQRHIQQALREGWLGIELAGRGGQGWRHNAYRAAVPDTINIDDLDAKLSNVVVSQCGDIEADDAAMSPRSPMRQRETTEGDDNDDVKVATSRAEGGDKPAPTSRHSYDVLTPASELSLITHAKSEAPIAQSSNQRALPEFSILGVDSEAGCFSRKTFTSRRQQPILQAISDTELQHEIERIARLLRKDNPAGYLGIPDAVKLLSARYSDVTVERFATVAKQKGSVFGRKFPNDL